MTANQRMVFVDPGKHDISLSVWVGGQYVHAEYFRGLNCAKAHRVASYRPDIVVVEKPQVYIGDKNRKGADAADLIDVALAAGACQAACAVSYSIRPNHWKGQVTKEIMLARYEAAGVITASMRDAVRTVPGILQHNVWDAIFLGLWWFKTHPIGALGYEAE